MNKAKEKKIVDMIEVVYGSIVDQELLKGKNINTIVNAAKPTLMGSEQGVDGAIHKAIDELLQGEASFNKKICEELGSETEENMIRCKRGQAVTTKGYKLCDYVIHVVGAIYDGNEQAKCPLKKACTSSCVSTLESCYANIVEKIKKHTDIENVAIPIIGSGEYGFPFETAMKIAVAGVWNALVKWKREDKEMFEMAKLKKIYFVIYDPNVERVVDYQCAQRVLEEYQKNFQKEKRVVDHTSLQAFFRYWQEIIQNDDKRGYFATAKRVRYLLMLLRVIFLPVLCIKDFGGQKNWEMRRIIVEWTTFAKAMIALFCCGLARYTELFEACPVAKGICIGILIYGMMDTITYLLSLILMADIQHPSANLTRSLILLFVNYIEVSLENAFLYYELYKGQVGIKQAIAFGLWGENAVAEIDSLIEYVFFGFNTGVRFFFVTLVLTYFMNHMKPREFRS